MPPITYFKLVDGHYEEGSTYLLPGMEWTEGSNEFRAIAYMFNFHSLVGGNQITWIYSKEIKPDGMDEWIKVSDNEVTISNSQFLSLTTGLVVEPSEALENGLLKFGYIRQLDFFIGAVGKGLYGETPIYPLMMNTIARREGIE